MAIGLVGGSFNPAHDGHRQISLEALKHLSLDRIWWLVTPGNPLKSHDELARLDRRMAAAAALADHPRIIVTGLETAIGTAYTAETIRHLLVRYPAVRFVWVMGADNLAGFHRWRDWRAIAASVPMLVADRPGWRYRALASRAAIALRPHRVCEAAIGALARLPPPAWAFPAGPLSPLSSTAIRDAERVRRIGA